MASENYQDNSKNRIFQSKNFHICLLQVLEYPEFVGGLSYASITFCEGFDKLSPHHISSTFSSSVTIYFLEGYAYLGIFPLNQRVSIDSAVKRELT
jgi:hypothetical protein